MSIYDDLDEDLKGWKDPNPIGGRQVTPPSSMFAPVASSASSASTALTTGTPRRDGDTSAAAKSLIKAATQGTGGRESDPPLSTAARVSRSPTAQVTQPVATGLPGADKATVVVATPRASSVSGTGTGETGLLSGPIEPTTLPLQTVEMRLGDGDGKPSSSGVGAVADEAVAGDTSPNQRAYRAVKGLVTRPLGALGKVGRALTPVANMVEEKRETLSGTLSPRKAYDATKGVVTNPLQTLDKVRERAVAASESAELQRQNAQRGVGGALGDAARAVQSLDQKVAENLRDVGTKVISSDPWNTVQTLPGPFAQTRLRGEVMKTMGGAAQAAGTNLYAGLGAAGGMAGKGLQQAGTRAKTGLGGAVRNTGLTGLMTGLSGAGKENEVLAELKEMIRTKSGNLGTALEDIVAAGVGAALSVAAPGFSAAVPRQTGGGRKRTKHKRTKHRRTPKKRTKHKRTPKKRKRTKHKRTR